MRLFSEQRELIQFAKKFIVEDRIQSLENDVKRCISNMNVPYPPAPFPALLYCFSLIDLLGALIEGNATKSAQTGDQAKEYMQRFMSYTQEQSELLQKVFRHKLVHLAQPRSIMENKSRLISWVEWHDNRQKHLMLESLKEKQRMPVTSTLTLDCDHLFHVGIWNLVEDIRLSVEKPNGYLHSLQTSTDLQDRFEKAISQIYDYK